MHKPKVLILRAAGINCEIETAHAWEQSGASPEIVHINILLENPGKLQEYQILTVPGGFSYGDDIAGGKILATQLYAHMYDVLADFASRDRLILGVCNGLQVLCKAGLLPGGTSENKLPPVTVERNLSGKYEDRWVRLQHCGEKCVFLRERSEYELPVAHGEGRILAESTDAMQRVMNQGCVALQYRSWNGSNREPDYPDNPNGSMLAAAGLCDPSGRIFGLMPHPERFIDRTHHPEWTSRSDLDEPHGCAIFKSAVQYFTSRRIFS